MGPTAVPSRNTIVRLKGESQSIGHKARNVAMQFLFSALTKLFLTLVFILAGMPTVAPTDAQTPICDFSLGQKTARCRCPCACPEPPPKRPPIAPWYCVGGDCRGFPLDKFNMITGTLRKMRVFGLTSRNDIRLTSDPPAALIEQLRDAISSHQIDVKPNLNYFFALPNSPKDYLAVPGAILMKRFGD